MPNGFVESRPARYGDSENGITGAYAQRFVCGGAGDQEISEIGMWCYCNPAGHIRFGIFSHDAPDNCPATLVTDSDTGELHTPTTMDELHHTYVTKPVVTGGSTYWICCIHDATVLASLFNTTGIPFLYKTDLSYPTWPTSVEWHTHFDLDILDLSFYAIYAAAGGAQSIVPLLGDTMGGGCNSMRGM